LSGAELAVQIVTWNSAAVIDACLDSLAAQEDRGFDLVVVDNASRDDTPARVRRALAGGLSGRLLESGRNEGFCGGHNRGLAASRSAWVLLLNPDATLPPDFVARFRALAARLDPEVGSVAPLILLPDGLIDSSGLFLDRYRRVFDRGQGTPPGPDLREEDVLGGTGAVVWHRRAMLEDVAEDGQALDERLFAYFDDLDLSWRAQLRGWRCRFVPALRAVHGREGRNAIRPADGRHTSGFAQRLALRNRLLVLLKCERGGDLLRALPWLLPYEIARLGYALVSARASLGGYLDALRLGPAFWRSRRRLQARARPARLRAAPFFPWRERSRP